MNPILKRKYLFYGCSLAPSPATSVIDRVQKLRFASAVLSEYYLHPVTTVNAHIQTAYNRKPLTHYVPKCVGYEYVREYFPVIQPYAKSNKTISLPHQACGGCGNGKGCQKQTFPDHLIMELSPPAPKVLSDFEIIS